MLIHKQSEPYHYHCLSNHERNNGFSSMPVQPVGSLVVYSDIHSLSNWTSSSCSLLGDGGLCMSLSSLDIAVIIYLCPPNPSTALRSFMATPPLAQHSLIISCISLISALARSISSRVLHSSFCSSSTARYKLLTRRQRTYGVIGAFRSHRDVTSGRSVCVHNPSQE